MEEDDKGCPKKDGCDWVNVSSGAGLPGSPGQKAVKRLCVCDIVSQFTNAISDDLTILQVNWT